MNAIRSDLYIELLRANVDAATRVNALVGDVVADAAKMAADAFAFPPSFAPVKVPASFTALPVQLVGVAQELQGRYTGLFNSVAGDNSDSIVGAAREAMAVPTAAGEAAAEVFRGFVQSAEQNMVKVSQSLRDTAEGMVKGRAKKAA